MGNDRSNDRGTRSGNQDSRIISRSARQDLERKKILRNRAKKRAFKRRVFLSIFLFFFIIISLVGFTAFSVISKISTKNDLLKAVEPSGNEPVNILVLGMDVGDPDNPTNKSARRTDTMMVVNYNPQTKKVNIVSVPRDTLIEVDAHDEYGNMIPYWKINAAYALGGEEEVITHVQKLLDIKINYMVEVDYTAFRSLIDAIGGIDVDIERDMIYDDDMQNLHINFKKGESVHLDGQKAEEFFRWRKNNDGTGFEEGDIGRIDNQHKFISKVVSKLTSPSIIFKIPTLLKVLESNISTNMPGSKVASYALKFAFNKGMDMHTLQGTNETLYQQDFLVVEPKDNVDIINALKAGSASAGNSNTSTSTIERGNYKVLVLNGTKVSGLAGDYKVKLGNVGYTAVDVGNGDKLSKSTILCNDKTLKAQLQQDTGINTIKKNDYPDYSNYDAVIILGDDYSNLTLGN